MPLAASFSWFIESGGEGASSAPARSTGGVPNPLGNGILRPFRRTARADFATAEGIPLVKSDTGQLLGTPIMLLPWRHAYGANLDPLRHKSNTPILGELARTRIDEALKRWLAGTVDVRNVRVERLKSEPSKVGKNVLVLWVTVLIAGREDTIRVAV